MALDVTEHRESPGFVHDDEHRLVVRGGTPEIAAHRENGFLVDEDGRVIVIGPAGSSLGFTTFETVHSWTIGGTLAVASGDTNFIPPFFVTNATGQTVSLARCVHKINSGTSATVDVEVNGTPATGFGSISVTTSKTVTNPADVELADGDEVALVVTAVDGSPKNMTFTVVLKHTAD